jgi:hypothetical protein
MMMMQRLPVQRPLSLDLLWQARCATGLGPPQHCHLGLCAILPCWRTPPMLVHAVPAEQAAAPWHASACSLAPVSHHERCEVEVLAQQPDRSPSQGEGHAWPVVPVI